MMMAVVRGDVRARRFADWITVHLIQDDEQGPKCVPLPSDWFMNVAFNYIKFASYSAVPFVIVLTLNIAVVYRTCLHFTGQSTNTVNHQNTSITR